MITLNKLTTGYAKNRISKEISTQIQLEIKKGSLEVEQTKTKFGSFKKRNLEARKRSL